MRKTLAIDDDVAAALEQISRYQPEGTSSMTPYIWGFRI